MPNRCVLNGLKSAPIPQEMENLNCLERHLIQWAKYFMCIVRLQPYSMKVSSHNSLRACSGAVCYLPLSTKTTVETSDQVQSLSESLPVPEVSIFLHTAPTKRNVVYRSLISVDKITAALQWLTCNNSFYCDVDESCIEDETVIQELDKATSDVLKETDFQSYTIRDMDTRQPITPDVKNYKMNRIQEHPLDSRQKHLDVLCFPNLFPTGEFGQFHSRQKNLDPREYIKSRLLK